MKLSDCPYCYVQPIEVVLHLQYECPKCGLRSPHDHDPSEGRSKARWNVLVHDLTHGVDSMAPLEEEN